MFFELRWWIALAYVFAAVPHCCSVHVFVRDEKRYSILFQSVVLPCHYNSVSAQTPVVQWVYKSYCRDRTRDSFSYSDTLGGGSLAGGVTGTGYNGHGGYGTHGGYGQGYENGKVSYLDCADSSRTVRTVVSVSGSSITLSEYYKNRDISITNKADLRIGEVQWGDSGVYICKVVISDDLEGQNEASVELLVLGLSAVPEDLLPGFDLKIMPEWVFVSAVALGSVLFLLLVGICWCQCCPHSCCCYVSCWCCPDTCCCPRHLYEAGKGINTGASTPAFPPYFVSGVPAMVPIAPPSLVDKASVSIPPSDATLVTVPVHAVNASYHVPSAQDQNSLRVLQYVEKQLAHFNPARSTSHHSSSASELSSLHEGENNFRKTFRNVQKKALPAILDVDAKLEPEPQRHLDNPASPQRCRNKRPSPKRYRGSPPSPQRSRDRPPSPQHSRDSPPSPPRFRDSPPSPPRFRDRPPSPQRYRDSPPSLQHSRDRPPSPQRSRDRPPSPQRYRDSPPSLQHSRDRPPSPQRYRDRPPSPQRYRDSPPSLQHSRDRPPSPQRYRDKPASPLHHQNRPSSPNRYQSNKPSTHHFRSVPPSPERHRESPATSHHYQNNPPQHYQSKPPSPPRHRKDPPSPKRFKDESDPETYFKLDKPPVQRRYSDDTPPSAQVRRQGAKHQPKHRDQDPTRWNPRSEHLQRKTYRSGERTVSLDELEEFALSYSQRGGRGNEKGAQQEADYDSDLLEFRKHKTHDNGLSLHYYTNETHLEDTSNHEDYPRRQNRRDISPLPSPKKRRGTWDNDRPIPAPPKVSPPSSSSQERDYDPTFLNSLLDRKAKLRGVSHGKGTPWGDQGSDMAPSKVSGESQRQSPNSRPDGDSLPYSDTERNQSPSCRTIPANCGSSQSSAPSHPGPRKETRDKPRKMNTLLSRDSLIV